MYQEILDMNKVTPYPKLEHYKKSFVCSGSVLWNQLPDNLKSVDSLDIFKILVRKHIAFNK